MSLLNPFPFNIREIPAIPVATNAASRSPGRSPEHHTLRLGRRGRSSRILVGGVKNHVTPLHFRSSVSRASSFLFCSHLLFDLFGLHLTLHCELRNSYIVSRK